MRKNRLTDYNYGFGFFLPFLDICRCCCQLTQPQGRSFGKKLCSCWMTLGRGWWNPQQGIDLHNSTTESPGYPNGDGICYLSIPETHRHTHKQTNERPNEQTNKQPNKQANKQTHTQHTHKHKRKQTQTHTQTRAQAILYIYILYLYYNGSHRLQELMNLYPGPGSGERQSGPELHYQCLQCRCAMAGGAALHPRNGTKSAGYIEPKEHWSDITIVINNNNSNNTHTHIHIYIYTSNLIS
jgi:hypothetical protein